MILAMIKNLLLILLFTFSVSSNAEEVDFLKERLALAEDSNYEPYALHLIQIGLLKEHHKRISDPSASLDDINEPLQKLSELYPLSIQANFAIAGLFEYVAKYSEDQSQVSSLLKIAQLKKKRAQSILNSILTSGDGSSRETAYWVINIAEEDAVINHLKLTRKSQAVFGEEDSYYDVITASDSTGKEIRVYFEVSSFYEK